MHQWSEETSFGTLQFVRLVNDTMDVVFCDYGAMIYDLKTKDQNGQWQSIVMQYDHLEDYHENPLYMNAVVGPIAGRIQGASFELNNKTIQLQPNHLETESLHSGEDGLSFVCWSIDATDTFVVFRYETPLESAFPGRQRFEVHYTLVDSSLLVEFHATTTEDTVVNLTQHAYFNLSGNLTDDILGHHHFVRATKALRLNQKFSPVGVEPVPAFLDFSRFQPLTHHLTKEVDQQPTKGIDHPLLLDHAAGQPDVVLYDPHSNRSMSVTTSYPCVVVYTHNHPDTKRLKHKDTHPKRCGICFETQYEPNGINVEGLHSAILRAGERYYHQTRFTFGLGRPVIR